MTELVRLPIEATKICTKCGATKPLENFHRRKAAPDGLAYECRTCARERTRVWIKANRERVIEYQRDYKREYRAANREALAEYNRAWYEANRDRNAARSRAWAGANPERTAEISRGHYERNRERVNARSREWKAAHPETVAERNRVYKQRYNEENSEEIAERNRNYRRANRQRLIEYDRQRRRADPVKYAEYRRARRARLKGVISEPYTRDQVWALTHGVCWLCNTPITTDEWHIEHRLPLSKGGSDTLANLAPAHPECNGWKKDRVLIGPAPWCPPPVVHS